MYWARRRFQSKRGPVRVKRTGPLLLSRLCNLSPQLATSLHSVGALVHDAAQGANHPLDVRPMEDIAAEDNAADPTGDGPGGDLQHRVRIVQPGATEQHHRHRGATHDGGEGLAVRYIGGLEH